MLCHLLESFDIVHVLAEAFLSSPYKCPDSPISTIYCTELYTFAHSNSAAPIHFRHFSLLAEFACT